MKYVLVTGGVVSGLGKGVTASSIGVLLKACGLRVTSIKIGKLPLPRRPFLRPGTYRYRRRFPIFIPGQNWKRERERERNNK
jgi:hypothetical protein